jgi:hypothetical protein
MPIYALRTENVGVPTTADNRVPFDPNSTNEAGNRASVQEFWCARVGIPTPQRVG